MSEIHRLAYTKLHACGNDFLVVEQAALHGEDEAQLTRMLCARTTGVGADGVEFLTQTGALSGAIRLRNADGGLAEISGNGTRCVAAWMAHRAGASPGDVITLATDAGPRQCELVSREGTAWQFRQSMGVPRVQRGGLTLDDHVMVEGAVVDTGNPHFVLRVEDGAFRAHGLEWETLGRAVCFHPQFSAQTNVEFVHVLGADEIAIRIFERGVGPTTSSGTGTCASAAAAIAYSGAARMLRVHAPGGMQLVEWPDEQAEMHLTGPATLIAAGHTWPGAAR